MTERFYSFVSGRAVDTKNDVASVKDWQERMHKSGYAFEQFVEDVLVSDSFRYALRFEPEDIVDEEALEDDPSDGSDEPDPFIEPAPFGGEDEP